MTVSLPTAPHIAAPRISPRLLAGLSLGLISAIGLGVRLWGTNFGLPYLEHPDEWAVADRALHMVQTGNLDPLDYRNSVLPDTDRQAFTYPSLYIYSQATLFKTLALFWHVAEPATKPDFYLWGRMLTAVVGAATLVALFVVGARAYGWLVGGVAAAFMAFFHLHVTNSRYITTDVPSGFFAVLSFVFIVPIAQGAKTFRPYLLAGVCIGLAIGTKYNTALLLLALLVAHVVSRPRGQWLTWHVPVAGAASAAAFAATSPFLLIHLPNALHDMAAIVNHYQNQGHPGFEGDANWFYYIGAIAAENVAVIGLGLAGMVLALVRRRPIDIVLLTFVLPAYIQLSTYKVHFTRNLMPLAGVLCIFAALILVEVGLLLTKHWPLSKAMLVTVVIIILLLPGIGVVHDATLNAQPTTRVVAQDWIARNVPYGAKLWIEGTSVEALSREHYRVEGGQTITLHPPQWYAANGYNYIVLSDITDQPLLKEGKPQAQTFYRNLRDGSVPVPLTIVQTIPPDQNTRPGPRITILATGLPIVSHDLSAMDATTDAFAPVDLGGIVRLLGHHHPATMRAGATVNVTLYWQSLKHTALDYTVFVHVLDGHGKIVSQIDLPPLAGTRPTSLWQPSDVMRDDYTLLIPSNVAKGTYHVYVGFYQPADGSRLASNDGTNEIDLGTLVVN